MLRPTPEEQERRQQVLDLVCERIRAAEPILLPPPPAGSDAKSDFALVPIAKSPNAYNGTVGEYIYQFEGEDDLLHIFVVKTADEELELKEAQAVFEFLFPTFPPALSWTKSGTVSHHFYMGHDNLLEYL